MTFDALTGSPGGDHSSGSSRSPLPPGASLGLAGPAGGTERGPLRAGHHGHRQRVRESGLLAEPAPGLGARPAITTLLRQRGRRSGDGDPGTAVPGPAGGAVLHADAS